jgi:hypothetical protein
MKYSKEFPIKVAEVAKSPMIGSDIFPWDARNPALRSTTSLGRTGNGTPTSCTNMRKKTRKYIQMPSAWLRMPIEWP